MSVTPLEIGVYSRSELLREGFTSWTIDRAIEMGRLFRLRRNHYVAVSDSAVDRAVRIGARLSCVTLLALLGAFVFDGSVLHVQAERTASRLRSARDARVRWNRRDEARSGVLLHWGNLLTTAPARHSVAVIDAVRSAIRCQAPRHAIATLDSALHLGLVTLQELRDVFTPLPAKYGALLDLVDGRCESGPETLVRLMLRQLGAHVVIQRDVAGVRRVDFIVDGWLIIECDSKAHHGGWEESRRDRRRDIAAARLGFTTVRPIAEDILYRPDQVRSDLAAVLAVHR